MAKAWYLYNGSGNPSVSSSYTIYNFSNPLTQPPCPDGCKLCAIYSTTGNTNILNPISPLSNNILAYLSAFFIAQSVQPPYPSNPYIVGKRPC